MSIALDNLTSSVSSVEVSASALVVQQQDLKAQIATLTATAENGPALEVLKARLDVVNSALVAAAQPSPAV